MEIFINMKNTFSKIVVICLAFAFSVIMFTLGASAMGNMAGASGANGGMGAGAGVANGTGGDSSMRSGTDMGGSSRAGSGTGAGSGSIQDRAGVDSGSGADTTMYGGNIDSGTDGHIDDTGSHSMTDNPIGRAAGDMVRGAENAVEEVSGGMGIWGVIITVVIIAAILALIFAFFRKK